MNKFNLGDISDFANELNGIKLEEAYTFIKNLHNELNKEGNEYEHTPCNQFYNKALKHFYKQFIRIYKDDKDLNNILQNDITIKNNIKNNAYHIALKKGKEFKGLNNEIKKFLTSEYNTLGPIRSEFTIIFHNLIFTKSGIDFLNKLAKKDSDKTILLIQKLMSITLDIEHEYNQFKNSKISQLYEIKKHLYNTLKYHAFSSSPIPSQFDFSEINISNIDTKSNINFKYTHGYFLATFDYYKKINIIITEYEKNTPKENYLNYKFKLLDDRNKHNAFWARVLIELMNDIYGSNKPSDVLSILRIISGDIICDTYVKDIIKTNNKIQSKIDSI